MTASSVPLVIGVTGHRDLLPTEENGLEAAVEAFFNNLRQQFPALPLLVMTPLAEGADRLVARVAQRLGIAISIVLPMPRHLYRADFKGLSNEVFEEMLGYGDVIELPVLDTQPAAREAPPEGRARDAQYEFLGIYLAAHCHILLALWDGRPSSAPGGTAHVIRFHHENELILISGDQPRSAIDFSEDESDLAYHIACSRQETGAPAVGLPVGEGRWLTRDDIEPHSPTMPARYAAVFRRMEVLNADLARFSDLPADTIPAYAIANHADSDVGPLFNAADTLAMRYQRRALRAMRSMYLLAALTGISFIVYADFANQERAIWAYLLFLALGICVYLLERRGAWYRRYLDYRGLAEGLRVQYYWALAGVHLPGAAEFPHDRFMMRQDLELGWIRNVMRYAGRRTDAEWHTPADHGLEATVTRWLGIGHPGEIDYYRQRSRHSQRRSRLTGTLTTAGFLSGLVCALALAVWQSEMSELTRNTLIALMAGLPFVAAVRSSYAQRTAERELIAEYRHMERIFTNAERLLAVAADVPQRRAILRALGEEALNEVGQWMLRQRERPHSGGQLFSSG